MKRGKHREEIRAMVGKLQGDSENGWVRGKDLAESLPHINPSSVRMTALLMCDDGELRRRRTHGETGRGQAVEYRVEET